MIAEPKIPLTDEQLQELVSQMKMMGRSEADINAVIAENEAAKMTSLTPDPDGKKDPGSDTILKSGDGESTSQKIDELYSQLNPIRQTNNGYTKNKTLDARDIRTEKKLLEPIEEVFVKNSNDEKLDFIIEKGPEQELTDEAKLKIENDYNEISSNWNKNSTEFNLENEEDYDVKAKTIAQDLVNNNSFLKNKNKQIISRVDEFINQPNGIIEQIIKKLNLTEDSSAEDFEEANELLNKEIRIISEQLAKNDPEYQAVLSGISNIVGQNIRTEAAAVIKQKARDNMEFKIPFTNTLLPFGLGKGVSDKKIPLPLGLSLPVEYLQKFGKSFIQSLYGIELATVDSGRARRATDAINKLNDKIEKGEITLEDKVDKETKMIMQGYIKDPNMTVKETLDYLDEALKERQEEQIDTIKDIKDINKDLKAFAENTFWDEKDNFNITPQKILNTFTEQGPQLALALVGGGIGVMVQETGQNYINNLYEITKKKFNIPVNIEPTIEQLMEVVNSGEDEVGIAAVSGIVSGFLENLSANQLLKVDLSKPIGSIVRGEFKIAAQSLANAGKIATNASLTEALTEGLQGSLSQLGESIVTDENRFDYAELREQATQGGIMGGLLSAGKITTTQSIVEFNQLAMKIAASLPNYQNSSLAQLESTFKKIERKIKSDGRLTEQSKRERTLSLGQVRNTLGKLPKDYNASQRQQALELLIRKENLNKKFENVDQSLIPQSIKDEFESIDNKLAAIAEDAYITKTVDMAQKEGVGENILTAKTSAEADRLAKKNNMSMTDKKGKRAEGSVSKDNKTIIIDLEQAKKVKAFNVAGHELLHRILFKTLYRTNEDGKLVGTNVARSLGVELDKELNKIDPSILKNDYLKARLKLYKDEGKTMQAEEKLTILSDALRLNAISLNENTLDRFNSFFRRLFQNLGFKKIKFKDGKDVINFIVDYNKSLDKGSLGEAMITGAKEGFEVVRGRDGIKQLKDDTIFKQKKSLSTNKNTLFEEINKLVPGNIKTKTEFDDFVRSPAGAKLFNAIYNEGGAINNYIRQRATTPEESQKIIDNTIERVLNFNPESTRDDGSTVGIKGFTERVMSDTRFAKLDAKKDLFKESERAKQEQQLDSPQAAQVIAEESTPTKTTKQQTSKLRRNLGIKQGDDLYNAVKQTAKEIFGKDLDNVELKKLKAIVNKKARGSELFKDIAKLMGTEKAIDPQFLNKNILNILKDLPISDLVKLERGTKGKKIFTKTGSRLGPIAARKAVSEGLLPKNTNVNSGPRVSEKLPVTLEQAKEFFTQKRKAGLVGVIAENLVADAAPSVTKEIKTSPKRRAEVLDVIDRDPELKFSISEGTKDILSKSQFDTGVKDVNALLNNYNLNPVSTITINELNDKSKAQIKKWIDNQIKYVFPTMPRIAFFGPSGGTAYTGSSKILGNDFGSLKDKNGKTIKDKNPKTGKYTVVRKNPVWEYFINEVKSLNDPKSSNYLSDKYFGKPVISKEADAELFKIKSYKTLFDTPSNIEKNIKNGEIKKFNEKVSLIHKTLWERINKSIIDTKKESASAIATYLRITANDTGHWHKQGANFVGYSTNPIGKINSEGKKTLYEYEHAMPATAAYMYLLDVSLSDGNFKPAYKAVMDNYKLIALDKAENAKLGKAKLGRGMPKGWELGKNFWWQRYFNPEVAAIEGGIPPNSIMMDNGRLMGNQLGVDVMGARTTKTIEASKKLAAKFNDKMLPPVDKLKGNFTNQQVLDKMAEVDNKNVSEELKFSKSIDLSKDMNDIIEAKTGIASEKTYSRVKAEVVGASKGRFDWFIPPSAEDFVGLLYKTLGKGKLGDSQMAWYKAHLLNPFARAMDNISRDRVALMNDFKALKKELKVVPKTLKKKVPGAGFTQEQAVRTYIWDKQGMNIPGLSKADTKDLVDFVNKNPDLVVFADQLIAMQKGDQYAAPSEGWLAGNITTDLIEGINTVKRAKYLEVWQTNADQIFSEANLNKLEAAYGKDYRVALENSLQRMKTGKNRSFGGDTLTGRVTDWLTNSIGAIMFFNTRSAVLQTISAINFINFSDNNIYKAGKAFANQKQFWKDFKTLFNSDFLIERRDGLRLNVNEADIADMAKKGGVRGVISELLRLGFLPTQIADSFAIASGGSTFYRNRIKSLEKQGLSTKEAETKAFQDFRETAEESQQSSRPDRISQQQAGPLGRIILAFANTPAQYARLMKKAASDLKNRRGDDKTNISKIIYYGAAQNLIFNALQQALFGLAFGDEEEEDKKEKRYVNVANGMADSLLRGMGLGGAIFSVLKNTALRLSQESEKKSPKYQDVLVKEITQLSPPIASKLGKLRQAGRSYSWNRKEMMEKGWSIDNPAYLAAAQAIAATTNIPLDRALKKIDNIRNASNSDLEAWQRVASAAGWSAWELGIDKNEKADVKLTRSEELFKLNKKDQIDLLLKLGLTKDEIKKLRLEKNRVEAIINKEKNNK